MKHAEETMIMLEYYDLTRSFRAADELAGVSPNTVAAAVERRAGGRDPGESAERERRAGPYLAKIEELVERSSAKVRADVVHERLLPW